MSIEQMHGGVRKFTKARQFNVPYEIFFEKGSTIYFMRTPDSKNSFA